MVIAPLILDGVRFLMASHFGRRAILDGVPFWTASDFGPGPRQRHGLVASPEILNPPEFKVETSYPNTFESGKFCSVNYSLTNPNTFRLLSCTFLERFLPYLKFSHG